MIRIVVASLLLGTTGSVPEPLRFAQLEVREQVTVRIRTRRAPPLPRVEWKEGKGLKCISADEIAGAAVMGPTSVDIILRDGRRIRAKLERSCPALDYYGGFYLRPARDRMVCADRDVIRSRVGGQCEIERFRTLKPVPRD